MIALDFPAVTAGWLATLCNPDSLPTGLDGPTVRPWLIEHDGDRWTVATNSKCLLAIRAELPGAQPATDWARINLVGFLGPPIVKKGQSPLQWHGVPWDDLKAWVGPYQIEVCPKCNGKGTIPNEQCDRGPDCEFCDNGKVIPHRLGRILGCAIDRNLLAQYLKKLPETDLVKVCGLPLVKSKRQPQFKTADTAVCPLYIDAFAWRVVLMPVLADENEKMEELEIQ